MNIAVLAGGLSPERDVSLSSGRLVAGALRRAGHRVVLADLLLGRLAGENEDFLIHSISEEIPDTEALSAQKESRAQIDSSLLELCSAVDIVFMALHGDIGENGSLQATFDTLGIRYTGSGYVGSLLAMDKDISKRQLASHGVLTPRGICFAPSEKNIPERIEREVGFPCVIKTCSGGSSIGLSVCLTRSKLEDAIELAARYDSRLIAEERIIGREFTVGLLDGRVLPAVEIIAKDKIYDYKNKYQTGIAREICPAEIDAELYAEIASAALRANEALRLECYARFDFICDSEGKAYCLEANTLPGMTPTSLMPQMAAAVGIGYDELCEKIVTLGLEKYKTGCC